MKKTLLFLAVVSLALGVFSPLGASAAEAGPNSAVVIDFTDTTPPEMLRASMGARVVSNGGNKLAVYLNNPEKLEVQAGDSAKRLQVIPIDADSVGLDAAGKAVELSSFAPGQQVRVMFSFYWQPNASPRNLVTQRLIQVQATGDFPQAQSTVAVDDFKRSVLVGTVMENNGDELELYVEAGRMPSGSVDYMIQGSKLIRLQEDTVIVDSDGKAVRAQDIRRYRRVAVTVGDAIWAMSYPPQLGACQATRIVVYQEGESLFAPAELGQLDRLTCTVVRREAGADGEALLVVQPDPDSREAKYRSEYVISAALGQVTGSDGQTINLESLQPGTRLEVTYTGLVTRTSPGEIPWFNSIRVL